MRAADKEAEEIPGAESICLERRDKLVKITVAIDSFKGSITSVQAGEAVRRGIRRADPDVQVTVRPLADGGEGTVESLIAGMGGADSR